MTRRLTLVMAIGCGVSVGNLYYAQPLLNAIAHDLHVGYGEAGLIVTLSQAGYALGLLLLVPLGDLIHRRTLVVRVLLLTCLSLAAAGLAPSLTALDIAIAAVGITTVVPQILVPFAAELAPEERRGKVVGTVMSGLLIGILLARTVSGLLAELGTWRIAFLAASGAMLCLALLLWRELPDAPPSSNLSYPRLMHSILEIVREEDVIRWRSLYGSLCFACFSVLWTSIAFLLSGPPFEYGPAIIGLFGLLGAAGALMANLAGRLADAGRTRSATGALFTLLCASFGLLALGRHELAPLLVGVVALDLAVQGIHILNQATIYTRRPQSRGRVTTVYMTCYFIGGVVGSAAASGVYAADGWGAVCALGAAFAALGLLSWLVQATQLVGRIAFVARRLASDSSD
ncbi:MAG TPA: MFS transporter [Solirubrobacteraceae bacterium]